MSQTKKWKKIKQLLLNARKLLVLPPEEGEHLDYVLNEFFTHNELGLAWDALGFLDKNLGNKEYWSNLAEAANLMELSEEAARAWRNTWSVLENED